MPLPGARPGPTRGVDRMWESFSASSEEDSSGASLARRCRPRLWARPHGSRACVPMALRGPQAAQRAAQRAAHRAMGVSSVTVMLRYWMVILRPPCSWIPNGPSSMALAEV